MEPFSALLALCAGNSQVTAVFPAQRPVTWSFDVFFDLCLNKHLSKQLWGWWFETPSCSFWRHCNEENIGEAMWVCHHKIHISIQISWDDFIFSTVWNMLSLYSVICHQQPNQNRVYYTIHVLHILATVPLATVLYTWVYLLISRREGCVGQ